MKLNLNNNKTKTATNSKEALELIKKAKKGDTIILDEREEEINERLEEELDKQFPKGDKARGRALVLFAIAQQEIDKAKEQAEQDEIKFLEDTLKQVPKKSETISLLAFNTWIIGEIEKRIAKLKEKK